MDSYLFQIQTIYTYLSDRKDEVNKTNLALGNWKRGKTKTGKTKKEKMESNKHKCEMCVRKGSMIDRVAVFLCFVCEMFVCVDCLSDHSSHDGMSVEREKMEGMRWISESERTEEKSKGLGKTSQCEDGNDRQKTEIEKENEDETEIRRIAKKLWDDVINESGTEREKKFKTNKVSICDRVKVKHEFDQTDCGITGLCGLENRRWVACDCYNSCIKVLRLGSRVIQRYIRFVGSDSKPWGVTEIHLKQNSAEPSIVPVSSSGISEIYRADPDKQCFIAVTLPWKYQILFIDVSKKPALCHKVVYTEKQCCSVQFYDDKIFTVCEGLYGKGRYGSPYSVYIKSTDGVTLNKFDTGIYCYFPYLAVVSGRVYLTDWHNHKIQCRNVEGQVIKDKTIQESGPEGISVDPDNNIYVCAWQHDKVYKLDADLTGYKSVLDQTADYLKDPYALCYYKDKLFVSHYWPPSLSNFVTVVRL